MRKEIEFELVKTLKGVMEYEGFEEVEYLCPAGFPSIGHGRNLDIFPLDSSEPNPMTLEYSKSWTYLQLSDIRKSLVIHLPWIVLQPAEVRIVLTDMAYNMGLKGLLKFKNMIAALKEQDYVKAADELRDSKYYEQTGQRARRHYRTLRGIV